MRPQNLVFGEVAELYDRFRPPFPGELFYDTLNFGGTAPGSRVLDVGAGTGKSSRPLAEQGFDVLALEPHGDMAAIAESHGLRTAVTTFEHFDAPPASFELVVSGQAWHWIDRAIAWRKTHRLLVRGGTLAIFYNRPSMPNAALRAQLDDTYERLAPSIAARAPGWSCKLPEGPAGEAMAASGLFAAAPCLRYRHTIHYSAGDYVGLMLTQSDHRMLPEAGLRSLLDAIHELVEAAGGVTVEYEAQLFLGLRRAA